MPGPPPWARYRESERILEVDFKGKDGTRASTYEYLDFPPESWAMFCASGKPAAYFATLIRGRYEFRKIPSHPKE